MKDLVGKVAVVTGAASGIGLALATRFAEEGMNVVLSDIEPAPLEAAVSSLASTGARVIGVVTDVSDPASVDALAARTLEEFGGVHLVCNNAGVESGDLFSDIPLDTWKWVMGVNFYGVLNGCRTFLPLLRLQPEGHIVNTASMSAFSAGVPTFAPYNSSKFAVLGLSESLETELRTRGEHVGVSLLAPGPVKSNLTRAERNDPAQRPPASDDSVRAQVIADLTRTIDTDGLDPASVAELVVSAVRENRFFVLTHPDNAIAAVTARLEWMTDGTPPPARRGGR